MLGDIQKPSTHGPGQPAPGDSEAGGLDQLTSKQSGSRSWLRFPGFVIAIVGTQFFPCIVYGISNVYLPWWRLCKGHLVFHELRCSTFLL